MRIEQLLAGLVRALAVFALVTGLTACAETQKSMVEPSFYRSLAQAGIGLDAAAAASMISGYRANNGLPAVELDPQLMQMADAHARAMAARNQIDRPAGGAFNARLKQSGYDAKAAAENVSAGYHTLAEAFSGWRDSPPHRANMLLKGATKMGIAAVYVPGSKYKVFWALILAAPEDRSDDTEKSSFFANFRLAKATRQPVPGTPRFRPNRA